MERFLFYEANGHMCVRWSLYLIRPLIEWDLLDSEGCVGGLDGYRTGVGALFAAWDAPSEVLSFE